MLPFNISIERQCFRYAFKSFAFGFEESPFSSKTTVLQAAFYDKFSFAMS
jgi:hypothetical protein